MKKKINIVLIFVVLGLWGTVAYKTITQYFFPKEIILNSTQSNIEFNSKQITKDTFNLEKINRDPFLNIHNNPAQTHQKKYTSVVKPVAVPQPVIIRNWPFVGYYGYIKSKGKDKELVLVKINQKIYKLRKDDAVEEVTLKKIYNDSIEVVFNKEKKMVRLN
ncbi:MAG: hypothetical protein V4548_12115 [Bacteroidota bacterium]